MLPSRAMSLKCYGSISWLLPFGTGFDSQGTHGGLAECFRQAPAKRF